MLPSRKVDSTACPGASPYVATDFACGKFCWVAVLGYTLRPETERRSLSQSEVINTSETESNGRKNLSLFTWLKSDVGILVLVAIARVVLHTATNGQYGFHRDELQTLDDARHLDWGFVVYPPIGPVPARLELILFGSSLAGFRVLAAVAVSAELGIPRLMAQELGGARPAPLLAPLATRISSGSLP